MSFAALKCSVAYRSLYSHIQVRKVLRNGASVVRRFLMEPVLESLLGRFVPISRCLFPLGVAILRH